MFHNLESNRILPFGELSHFSRFVRCRYASSAQRYQLVQGLLWTSMQHLFSLINYNSRSCSSRNLESLIQTQFKIPIIDLIKPNPTSSSPYPYPICLHLVNKSDQENENPSKSLIFYHIIN